ncbi:MAG TPA: tetratricopeptide repeat protein, partial [Anaerovoracaceae bacterium]|nr:tetratricopeptide repeat protein [Anaerovoracaceae bacterium]
MEVRFKWCNFMFGKSKKIDVAASEEAYLEKGNFEGETGNYDKAIEYFDKVIEINPENDWAWQNKGVSLSNLGREEEAIECYDRALELNPQNDRAWENKGVSLSNLGREEEAIECFDEVLSLNPQNDRAWERKGLSLSNLDREEEAIECYDRALELNPQNDWARQCKSDLLLARGRAQEIKSPKKSAKESSNPITKPDKTPTINYLPIVASAFGYKGATIQYKVKVENNTAEPIAAVKINLYVPDVFLVSKSTQTIDMLKPGEGKTVTFEIRPTGECGDCEVSGKVVYYDYSTRQTTGIDIPPKSLSIICPMLKMMEINESQWYSTIGHLIEIEECTQEIYMSAEHLFTMTSRIVKDMHMHPLNPEINNSQQ